MPLKTIKNVDDETWYKFRKLAVKNRLAMGELLEKMVKEYDSNSADLWNEILRGKRILSDKEADELLQHTKQLRKDYGFRK